QDQNSKGAFHKKGELNIENGGLIQCVLRPPFLLRFKFGSISIRKVNFFEFKFHFVMNKSKRFISMLAVMACVSSLLAFRAKHLFPGDVYCLQDIITPDPNESCYIQIQ